MIKQKSESLKTPTAGRLFAVMSVFVCMLITNIPAVGDSDKTGEFISADDAGWRAQAMNAITEMEYQITLRDRKDCRGDQSEYHAVNRRQDLRIFFKGDGLRIVRRTESSPSWNWSWRLNALGRRGDLHNTAQPIRAAHRNIMEYRRPGLLETYENTEAGFIQRLELNVPPAGSGPVEIKVMCGTGLEVTQIGRGVPVDFRHEGRTILQYSEMTATDTAEKTLPAEIIFENDLATIVVNDEGALYPLSVTLVVKGPADGMLPGFPDWTYADDREDAQLGFSVATAGDVNGDGFSDVIVGAYQYDEDFGNQGKVFVFHGSETGLPTLPSWMFSGPSSEHFGWSVATAGDVNGDGFSDIVVGSPRYTFNSEIRGKAYVFHGSRDGLAVSPSWVLEGSTDGERFGECVATAGNVNRDLYGDVLIGAPEYKVDGNPAGKVYLFYGTSWGLQSAAGWTMTADHANARLGHSVAAAGDVNGDNFGDIIIGEPNNSSNALSGNGTVYLYYGDANGPSAFAPDWVIDGDLDNAGLGTSVATAGDVNGDGYADVIIGAPKWNAYYGAAYVFHGSASGPGTLAEWRGVGEDIGCMFGVSVATAGDVNGDGYADIVAGQYYYDGTLSDQGASYLWLGGPGGLGGYSLTKDADWSSVGGSQNAEFGRCVAPAGDVNGDGYGDIIVGAPGHVSGTTKTGQAAVFHGGPGNLSQESGWDYFSESEGNNLGFCVSTAGDVNGDGFADIMAGAPYYDSGYSDEGAVFVWYGSSEGPNNGSWTGVNWFVLGGFEGSHLGFSVSTAGDINGDGYSDIIAGMPHHKNPNGSEGAAAVWYGSYDGIPDSGQTAGTTLVWAAQGNVAGAELGFSVGWAGDVNDDGYADIIIGAPKYTNNFSEEGIICVWYGSENGLGETGFYNNADWKYEGGAGNVRLGLSVGTAGDVNRDGCSDIIAGGAGFASAWYGHITGLPSSGTSWFKSGYEAGDGFGYSVGTAGDVNGDGYSDIIVGAPLYDSLKGGAWVYNGAQYGLSQTAVWADVGTEKAAFGYSVGTAGDVNGDGLADIVVGAPFYSNHPEKFFMGEVRVYYGNVNNPISYSGGDWVKSNIKTNMKMGYSVASAGDINGDGYADILVGSPMETRTTNEEGHVSLYYGNGIRGAALAPRQLNTGATNPIAPLGMSDNAGAFDIEMIGRTPAGRGRVALQYEYKNLHSLYDGHWIQDGTWYDSGLTGTKMATQIVSLTPSMNYHWRVRHKYNLSDNPFNPPTGRWVHIPWNGWNESDLKTHPRAITMNDIIHCILTGTGYVSDMDRNQDGKLDVSDAVHTMLPVGR